MVLGRGVPFRTTILLSHSCSPCPAVTFNTPNQGLFFKKEKKSISIFQLGSPLLKKAFGAESLSATIILEEGVFLPQFLLRKAGTLSPAPSNGSFPKVLLKMLQRDVPSVRLDSEGEGRKGPHYGLSRETHSLPLTVGVAGKIEGARNVWRVARLRLRVSSAPVGFPGRSLAPPAVSNMLICQ